jgi:phosphoserine phosphatase RsbU/P
MDTENDKRILIIGNDADSDEAVALKGAGYTAEIAGSVEEVMEKLASTAYTRVLGDPAGIVGLALCGGERQPFSATGDLRTWLLALQESEEIYRNLVERSNDGVVVLQDRLVKLANPRFIEMSGYSAETLLETPFTDYLTPDEIAVLQKRYEQRMAGEYVPAVYETTMTRRGGVKLPLEISAAMVSFRGRPADLVLIRDITERKQAEEYLQRFGLLSESAHDVILFFGHDGRIVDVNRSATETYGYTREELLTMGIRDLTVEESRGLVDGQLERAQREALLFETVHLRKGGGSLPVEVSISGAMIGGKPMFVGICRDITERKRTQAFLDAERWRATTLESIAEAGLSSLSLSDFLNTMVGRIAKAMSVDSTCIFVLDEEGQMFEAQASYNVPDLLGYRLGFNEGLVGKVAAERAVVYVPDTENEPLADPFARRGKSMLGVPLVARERVVGVLRVLSEAPREFTEHEVRLLKGIGDRVALAIDNARLRDALQKSRADVEDALERERHFSLLLQRALLPAQPTIGEGYTVSVGYTPVFVGREIGGDFYDVFPVGDGRAGALIGDVSGKGLEAASLAATTRSTIHAFVHEMACAGDALTWANSVLASRQEADDSFVTVFLVVLLVSSGEICYSNAGHPPGIIVRRDGKLDWLDYGNVPLGMLPAQKYPESRAQLDPGDKLLLFTDGISEARADGGMLDLEGIERTLAGSSAWTPEEVVQKLMAAATEWAHGKLRDDAAVVVVERTR